MKEPDKWCIKVTSENREAIEKWRTAKAILSCRGYCVNKNSFDDPSIGYWYPNKPEGYTEISFEEFKVYTSKPLKQAVYCETQEEWDFACDKYGKVTHVKTQFGKEYNTFSYTSSFRGWNTKEYYIQENYQILSFQEWCDLNGYKMEKEVKFEVGKWYKNLSIRNQKNTFGKFKRLSGKNNNEFWMSECIYAGKQVEIKEQWLNYSNETIEASIEEIQQYLPEGHPDKIKSDIKFEVGDWVLIKSAGTGNGLPANLDSVFVQLLKIDEDKQPTGHLKGKSDFMVCYNKNYYRTKKDCIIRHATPEEIDGHLAFTGQIQQYLPDDHPDKIKPNQEFKVGDWAYCEKLSDDDFRGDSINSHLYIPIFQIKEIEGVYLRPEYRKFNGVNMKYCRHATPTEINNHLISIGQISAEKYPFKKLKEDDLTWEIKTEGNQKFKVGDWVVVLEEDNFYPNSEKCPQKLVKILKEYDLPYRLLFRNGHTNTYEKIRHATEEEMQEYFRKNEYLLKKKIEAETYEYFSETPDRMKGKPSYHLLSIDDEELPMVNIIKTNTIKQLLNVE